MLRKRFPWTDEPCDNFDFIFSRLDPFQNSRVNFVDKLRVLIWKKNLRCDCLLLPDLAGFKILGSARDGGGRSNRDGLGRGASISVPPISPHTEQATVAGFDRIARAQQSVTLK